MKLLITYSSPAACYFLSRSEHPVLKHSQSMRFYYSETFEGRDDYFRGYSPNKTLTKFLSVDES
jgi:hypothetical protein